jgi:mannose-1-phosphate guanylyltransferase
MQKHKIAISINEPLLNFIDSKIDGHIIRSRSQAIEFFLRKGLKEFMIDTAIILLSKRHHKCALKLINNIPLIKKQLEFFSSSNIKKVLILTQHTDLINKIIDITNETHLNVRVFEKYFRGNASALNFVKDKIDNNFIVMSGDTYNNFDLRKMITKHLESNKLITMGLMSRDKPSRYGNVVLDGDLIIGFYEKPRRIVSNIVNAGIYIFKPEIFEFLDNVISLERDLFPKIARIKQLTGFFTHGEYIHICE